MRDIPRFVAGDQYAESFGFQWNAHRQTQLDSRTGLSISRDRLFAVSGWSTDLTGQRVLEAGSGAGRFTEVLLTTGAEVFSTDLSSAIEANLANNGPHPRLHLFQADILNLPVRQDLFDRVICLGVLQHAGSGSDVPRAVGASGRRLARRGLLRQARWTAMLQWK